MSNLLSKEQKSELMSLLSEVIRESKKRNPWIITGITANGSLAVWCLGFGAYNMFFRSPAPPRFFIVMNLLLSILNVWCALRGLNEYDKNKKFIASREEELEIISNAEVEE